MTNPEKETSRRRIILSLKAIRVKNLNKLINTYGRKQVRDAAGFDESSHFGQLVNGHGAFGEAVAKRFEEAFDLPVGWLSTDHDSSPEGLSMKHDLKDDEVLLLSIYRSLPESIKTKASQLLLLLKDS